MKTLKILSVLGLAIIASACGNIKQGTDNLTTSNFGQYTDPGSANPYLTAAQTCSENPNITSTQYPYASQTQYRACKGMSNNVLNVKIFTADSTAKNVCIFPVQVNGTTATPFIINPNAPAQARFAVQCVSVNGSGSTVSFGILPVNGIFVVDQANASMFATCLTYGDVKTCSANSGFTYSSGNL